MDTLTGCLFQYPVVRRMRRNRLKIEFLIRRTQGWEGDLRKLRGRQQNGVGGIQIAGDGDDGDINMKGEECIDFNEEFDYAKILVNAMSDD